MKPKIQNYDPLMAKIGFFTANLKCSVKICHFFKHLFNPSKITFQAQNLLENPKMKLKMQIFDLFMAKIGFFTANLKCSVKICHFFKNLVDPSKITF